LHDADTHTLAITLASAELGTWDWDITTGHVIFNEHWPSCAATGWKK